MLRYKDLIESQFDAKQPTDNIISDHIKRLPLFFLVLWHYKFWLQRKVTFFRNFCLMAEWVCHCISCLNDAIKDLLFG